MEDKIITISKRIVLFSSGLLIVVLMVLAIRESDRPQYADNWQQLTLTGLQRSERCISCHPDSIIHHIHPNVSLMQHHEINTYGCTVCHQGEGRAIKEKSAHKTLTPPRFLQSNCAQCHLALFNRVHETPNCEQIAQGKKILYQSGCLGCHKIRKTGGAVGPDITSMGDKPAAQYNYDHIRNEQSIYNWLEKHFYDPGKITPGSQMFAYPFPETDMQALITLITGLRTPVFSITYYDLETLKEFKSKRNNLTGQEIFGLFCSACHGDQRKNKSYPRLQTTEFLSIASDEYLQFILQEGRSNRPMASWAARFSGLYPQELTRIRDYIAHVLPRVPGDLTTANLRADPDAGSLLYNDNCAFCHGKDLQGVIGPGILNPDFLAIAPDSFVIKSIRDGRGNTAMPSWRHLSAIQIGNLLAYLRQFAVYDQNRKEEQKIKGDINGGRDKFHYLCSRCHGKEGWGEIAPAILNPDFLRHAPISFIISTIQNGRRHSAMFGWEKAVAGYGKQETQSILDITAFMISQKDSLIRRIYAGMNLGKPEDGKRLFQKQCSKCHGNSGEGKHAPALNNQEFLNAASNGFLTATLVLGRSGTDMPVWSKSSKDNPALTPDQINNLVSCIRTWQTITIPLRKQVTEITEFYNYFSYTYK
jgi:mono/diheme cytochrome c family protein